LDGLHRCLAQVQPDRVLGQYGQPVALRSNVTGMLASPAIVYWNVGKN
jgi:peptide/nickel transport system substrate-binding protein